MAVVRFLATALRARCAATLGVGALAFGDGVLEVGARLRRRIETRRHGLLDGMHT
jgi:hypothetical protein